MNQAQDSFPRLPPRSGPRGGVLGAHARGAAGPTPEGFSEVRRHRPGCPALCSGPSTFFTTLPDALSPENSRAVSLMLAFSWGHFF